MAKDFKLGPGGPTGAPKVNITPDMMRSFKTLTCDCGGQLFQTGVVIKKISALVSPTGNEEMYPMEVLVCMNCHKVPNDTNTLNMLPDGVLARKSPVSSSKFELPKLTGNYGDTITPKSTLSIIRDEPEEKKQNGIQSK